MNKRKFIFAGLLGALCLSVIIIGILIACNVVTRYLSSFYTFLLCSDAHRKKPTKTFYLLKINFRKREHKKSQTVDVQESQCGDTPYVSNNDVMRTEYQELRDRRTQIYENLS